MRCISFFTNSFSKDSFTPHHFKNSTTAYAQTVNSDSYSFTYASTDYFSLEAINGTLYFSTNSERLKFDVSKVPPKTAAGLGFTRTDITDKTIPNDFAGKKPHKVWEFKITQNTKELY